MGVQVKEESIVLTCDVLEPVEPVPGDAAHYPFSRLQPTGQAASLSFQTIVIDNGLLRARIVPELGGRLLEVGFLGQGSWVLAPPTRLSVTEHPSRGYWLPQGVQLVCGTSLEGSTGPVACSVHLPFDEAASGGVIVSGISRPGVDWTVSLSLPPDEASLLVEHRIHNRTLFPCRLDWGLTFDGDWTETVFSETCRVVTREGSGFVIEVDQWIAATAPRYGTTALSLDRPEGVFLGPRQTKQARLRLTPFVGVAMPQWAGDGTVAELSGEQLTVYSAYSGQGRVFVGLSDGSTAEAPAAFEPGRPIQLQCPAGVQAVAVRPGEGTDPRPLQAALGQADDVAEPSFLESALLEPRGAEAEFFDAIGQRPLRPAVPFGLEAAAATERAKQAIAIGSYKYSIENIDRAIDHNASDPLLWWLKAVAQRWAQSTDPENGALLNARYLAPHEPLVRAESFLAAPNDDQAGASQLLAPLAEDPDALCDALCLMIEHGLHRDAALVAEQTLKHRDHALVRYLLGYVLSLKAATLVDAADQVRQASRLPARPPYPWRPVEVLAVRALAGRFPADERLQGLVTLLDEVKL